MNEVEKQREAESSQRGTEIGIEGDALQRNIQVYLEGHVYQGRKGRKLDNG